MHGDGHQVLRSGDCVTDIMVDDLSEGKKHEGSCNGSMEWNLAILFCGAYALYL